MKKGSKTKLCVFGERIFDAWVDAADDLVDVLVDCTDAADMLKKEPAK